jgi:putative ABC transport system permease protein
VTCAIVCNAIFLIGERLARMDKPSGIAESELVRVQLTGIGQKSDAAAITEQDLVALRAIPGVKSVAATNMIPFGNSSWNTSIGVTPDDGDRPVNAAMYMGSPDLVETFGVTLVAGRSITEASGGVNLHTVRDIALAGVDWISVGALTHSAPALDLALDFE